MLNIHIVLTIRNLRSMSHASFPQGYPLSPRHNIFLAGYLANKARALIDIGPQVYVIFFIWSSGYESDAGVFMESIHSSQYFIPVLRCVISINLIRDNSMVPDATFNGTVLFYTKIE